MKRLELLAPWFFVLIWSSGFIVAKYVFPQTDVIYFLALRLIIAALVMALITKISGESLRLSGREIAISVAIGVAMHFIYLGGVWQAESLGAPAGIASVITSLQPLLVSIIAMYVLQEKLSIVQGAGLIIGFLGVILVVEPSFAKAGELTVANFLLLVAALLGSTSTTVAQKKIGHTVPLLAGTTYQFMSAGALFFALSFARGETMMVWNTTTIVSMAWAVLVTSVIAILILLWMLRHGSAARVSSLLYLVPAMTALEAFVLFGEKLNAQGVVGIAATALGVALVQRR